ncbi:MAG: carboxymuconolactone decarboxylase family protein [Spirochaetia bacterium]|nr:carboxymuconolactone decarboxylase family protein [Spirochaetia bacterium]
MIVKKKLGKKLYNIRESFMHLIKAFISIKYLSKAKKQGLISYPFQERLMLAVTEVNGCALCSYAHTKMALEAGLSSQEINNLLTGSNQEDTPEDELNAILFASYYAECRSKVDKTIWNKIVNEYGIEKALGILASIRIITVGNVYGIVLGSFISRFKKDKSKRDLRTNLFYELIQLISFIPFIIIAMILSLFLKLFKVLLI